jgi:DNA helicase-2/ATP-dependent DNA helicase PcrA
VRYVRDSDDVAYPVGSRVRHPKFGVGVVEAYTPRAAGSAARIAFKSVGVKTLILEYAKLQRVD